MIVVIDNYDSFTYNLVQYLGEIGSKVRVFRNDEVDLDSLTKMKPNHIVISPGPGTPDDAGISKQVIQTFGDYTPILGVCLGHQCIGEVFGGVVRQAPRLMHGKTSSIYHYGNALFKGVPSPFDGNRYHSLIVEGPLPPELQITAFTKEGEIMGIRHRELPVYGVQFHPESILTSYGMRILRNFVSLDIV